MTVSATASCPAGLHVAARAAGLRVLAEAAWPESPDDGAPPTVPGFIASSFSPLVAAAAERCLLRRHPAGSPGSRGPSSLSRVDGTDGVVGTGPVPRTGIVLLSAAGDLASAVAVAAAVDGGSRVGPLMFFQSVPHAVIGHLAARWGLDGPLCCVAPTTGGLGDGLELAALQVGDGDATEVLVVRAEQAPTLRPTADHATAVLVAARHPGGTA